MDCCNTRLYQKQLINDGDMIYCFISIREDGNIFWYDHTQMIILQYIGWDFWGDIGNCYYSSLLSFHFKDTTTLAHWQPHLAELSTTIDCWLMFFVLGWLMCNQNITYGVVFMCISVSNYSLSHLPSYCTTMFKP